MVAQPRGGGLSRRRLRHCPDVSGIVRFRQSLGTCWAGYFTGAANVHEPLVRALDLPPDTSARAPSCWGIHSTAIPGSRCAIRRR